MGDLCTCWDASNNVLILQHNEIKASFEMSLHVVGHNFNSTLYKHLLGVVSKYALLWIAFVSSNALRVTQPAKYSFSYEESTPPPSSTTKS